MATGNPDVDGRVIRFFQTELEGKRKALNDLVERKNAATEDHGPYYKAQIGLSESEIVKLELQVNKYQLHANELAQCAGTSGKDLTLKPSLQAPPL